MPEPASAIPTRPREGKSYIYHLTDPRDGTIFYVGHSRDPDHHLERLTTYTGTVRNDELRERLEDIIAAGVQPSLEVLEEVPEDEALDRQHAWLTTMVGRHEDLANAHGDLRRCRLPGCRVRFLPVRDNQKHCSPDHKNAYNRLARKVGDAAIRIALEALEDPHD